MVSQLAAYLDNHDITNAEFARLLGVRDSTVFRWATRKRIPTVTWAFAIEKATGGAVRASSWGKAPAASRRRAEPRKSGRQSTRR